MIWNLVMHSRDHTTVYSEFGSHAEAYSYIAEECRRTLTFDNSDRRLTECSEEEVIGLYQKYFHLTYFITDDHVDSSQRHNDEEDFLNTNETGN